ncbi:hypothetical protein EDB80DRAFT_693385 [Ilyonectria destructans]|nr:hypothetical protein EDB80DRAFT_693385 [Ilyonectria destructans]
MSTNIPMVPNPGKSWTGGPPSPQEIDRVIQGYGGTTTAFDSVETNTKTGKAQSSIREWVIELNQENGRLLFESYYYRNLVHDVLIRLMQLIQTHSGHLCYIVDNYTAGMGGAGATLECTTERMRSFSHPNAVGVMPGHHLSNSRCSDTGMQWLNDKGSLAASRIQSSPFIEPVSNESGNCGSTRELVVDLTRENGKLRYQISRDRSLVTKVLIHLVTELRFHSNSLNSIIQRFNAEIERSTIEWQNRTRSHHSNSGNIKNTIPINELNIYDVFTQYNEGALEHSSNSSDGSFGNVIAEHKTNTVSDSINDLNRQIEELRYEYEYYSNLVDYGLACFVPLVQFHLNKLRWLVHRCSEESQLV